jgi:hypothetical protein
VSYGWQATVLSRAHAEVVHRSPKPG